MTQLQTYHVRTHDDGWAVEAEGNSRPTAVESRKADAVSRAKELAGNQEPAKVIVHKQDGTVQDEFTYGDVAAATAKTPANDDSRVSDAGYALAALANDALELAGEALQLARELPSKARERAQKTGEMTQERMSEMRDLKARREDLETRIQQFREQAEERFDEKAARGRSLTEGVLNDERVRRVLDQAKTAQSQVKAALTSIRKTGESAASAATTAGKAQGENAKAQVKAAGTSVKKTAEAATGRS